MSKYYPVIGLEIHCQLATKTKMFCGCEVEVNTSPNKHVCPVCLGMPGAMPVPNKKAVEYAIRLGLALNCEIDLNAMWTRKNYFYPDLPKGYQITQTGGLPIYDHPICRNGWLEIKRADGVVRRIGITRIHMEEDAGKLVHDMSPTGSHFDANRCGTPLCEIVTEPDIRSPEEAHSRRSSRFSNTRVFLTPTWKTVTSVAMGTFPFVRAKTLRMELAPKSRT